MKSLHNVHSAHVGLSTGTESTACPTFSGVPKCCLDKLYDFNWATFDIGNVLFS